MSAATFDVLRRPMWAFDERIAIALERIADALEAQAAAQGATAEFFRSASQSVSNDAEQLSIRAFEDYRESTTLNHFLVLIGGAWLEANSAEDAAILDHLEQKRNR